MIRRRRTARQTRAAWVRGPLAPLARAMNSQSALAAITPRVRRVIDLIELAPGKRYVDIGCGSAAYAGLVASQAGMDQPPICLDLVDEPGRPDALVWPEHLPLADASVDCLTSFYFIRRFDDDVVHGFAGEISRVLAPGGAGLILELAPVKNATLNRLHSKLFAPGCAEVDLRGWGRLAALFTECGFDAIDLVNVGPFILPPIPRIGVLVRRRP